MGRSSENHVNLISGPIRVTDGSKGAADELETRPIFALEDIRQTVGILFDVSTSLRNKITVAYEVAMKFLQMENRDDGFSMIEFNDRAELSRDFTANLARLRSS
jgi:hypothetical protein